MAKQNYIELKNVAKTYTDGFTAVSNINLTIEKGSFVTLLGPSGCGKTTILKMLGGFETVTDGTIKVNDLIINDLPPNRRPISTVFQDYALFPNLTVTENIKFGLKLMRVPLEKGKIKDFSGEIIKLKREWKNKADKEIEGLQGDVGKINKKLLRIQSKYDRKPEWAAIKNLRWANYENKVLQLEEAKRNKLKNGEIYLDEKLTPNSTKFDKDYIALKKAFLSKQHIDKEVDIIKRKLSDKIGWISYWQNYTDLQVENYEKKYTTRPISKKEIKARVKDIIEKVGLTGKENKFPSDLSGGMQQRVALARSIVIEPEIILLDEPLSALDAKVRHQMQLELKRLHKELGLTFVLVTHDQEEALSLSTKVVVMSDGKIQQIGTPNEVYDTPTNKWVANFIGKANFFDAKFANNKLIFEGIKFNNTSAALAKQNPSEALLIVRPEDINIVAPTKGFIKGKIAEVIYKGLMYEVRCEWNDQEIQIETTSQIEKGKIVGLTWALDDTYAVAKPKEEANAK